MASTEKSPLLDSVHSSYVEDITDSEKTESRNDHHSVGRDADKHPLEGGTS